MHETDALVLVSLSTQPSEVVAWAGVRWPPPLASSVARWDAYVEHVRRSVEEDAGGAAGAPFGTCVRCGSRRLSVTTKQLRRADDRGRRRRPQPQRRPPPRA